MWRTFDNSASSTGWNSFISFKGIQDSESSDHCTSVASTQRLSSSTSSDLELLLASISNNVHVAFRHSYRIGSLVVDDSFHHSSKGVAVRLYGTQDT
jgi:hypothetical protein